MRCIWQIENDPYCNRVLAKHWPGVKRYGDIREVQGASLEKPDVLCGGFPCQDVSNAGKRAGIDGERSRLWGEMCRLVREIRPRIVVVENVPGLLVRGMGRVLGDLAESGYDAEWGCLPACAVGAPHIRNRVFILAYTAKYRAGRGQQFPQGGEEAGNVANTESHLRRASRDDRPETPDRRSADVANPNFQPLGRIAESRGQCNQWAVEPDVGRVADGVPRRVDRLRGLGNAVVPQVAEYIGRLIVGAG